jgi:hypothetical protein
MQNAESPGAMRYATRRWRRAATRLLAHEAGAEPSTSENLAAASARLLDRLSRRLAQVIGQAGVKAVFLRAVNLRKREFPFLDEGIVPLERGEGMAEPLRACLQKQTPEVIREVSVTLFATFAGVLVTVIGDRLTLSLLQQIWPDTLLPEAELQETEE